ncbi:MAG TPA: hypothetical protein VKG79_16965, partial [Bryobacteraceae bacterium]|nr:hypothetical protein [Bryobacteraceae bacterium]
MTSSRFEFAFAIAALIAVSASALAFVHHQGWILYYGDAESHLNIARRMIDTRTRDYDQLGTV